MIAGPVPPIAEVRERCSGRRAFLARGTAIVLGLLLVAPGCDSGPAPIPLEQFSGSSTLSVRYIDHRTGEFIDVLGPRATIEIPRFGAGRNAQRDRWSGTLEREAMILLAKWAEGADVLTMTGPQGESRMARFRTTPRYLLTVDREDGRIAIGWDDDEVWQDPMMRGRVEGAVSSLRQWARPQIP